MEQPVLLWNNPPGILDCLASRGEIRNRSRRGLDWKGRLSGLDNCRRGRRRYLLQWACFLAGSGCQTPPPPSCCQFDGDREAIPSGNNAVILRWSFGADNRPSQNLGFRKRAEKKKRPIRKAFPSRRAGSSIPEGLTAPRSSDTNPVVGDPGESGRSNRPFRHSSGHRRPFCLRPTGRPTLGHPAPEWPRPRRASFRPQ